MLLHLLQAGISKKTNRTEFFYLAILELLGILKVIEWDMYILKTALAIQRTGNDIKISDAHNSGEQP